ncbi:MAG TPA: hypothetical protein VLF79_00965 [Candidatus Saccharimonadales bacterium]|nr:hypothetical protein [Candidatus Saccharimonadales bacterium]
MQNIKAYFSKIKSKLKSKQNRNKPNFPINVAILLVLILLSFGIYKIASHHRSPAPLLSVDYMQKNCPNYVLVNVFVPGASSTEKFGVKAQAKQSTFVDKKPFVKYTWQLSNNNEFCGIVGVWPNPTGPQAVSLRPTTQTAHSGEYTDTSLHSSNGLHLTEFYVYARAAK